jgi:hypothetical protein
MRVLSTDGHYRRFDIYESLTNSITLMICFHCGRNTSDYRARKRRGYMIYRMKNHQCKARKDELGL